MKPTGQLISTIAEQHDALAEQVRRWRAGAARTLAREGIAVLRASRPAGEVDPWLLDAVADTRADAHAAFEPSAQAAQGFRMRWRGADGSVFVAQGAAHTVGASGEGRCALAEQARAKLAASSVVCGQDDLSAAPLLIGGMAFHPGEPAPGPWRAWPALSLVVPAWLAWRPAGEGQTRVVRTVVVRREADLDAGLRALTRPWQPAALREVPGGASRLWSDAGLTDIDAQIEAGQGEAGQGEAGQGEAGQGETGQARDRWMQRAHEARALLRGGALRKVVLARRVRLAAPTGMRFDPDATATALRRQEPEATVFALCLGGGGTFLGATPEWLVRTRGGRLMSMALAGTRRRGTDGEADRRAARALLASVKDREEHALVVEALREALEPVAAPLLAPEAPGILHTGQLMHLHTPLTAALRMEQSLLGAVGRLHPTPAVGGLPRAPALAWLRATEGADRGWYAGAVGWVSAEGEGDFAVAIRSALLTPSTAWAWAGAGLVGASDPAAEWRETTDKLRTAARGLTLCLGER